MAGLGERRCAKCGGQVVEAELTAGMGGGVLQRLNPGVFNMRYSRLLALVCLECRSTEFFAADPSKLLPR